MTAIPSGPERESLDRKAPRDKTLHDKTLRASDSDRERAAEILRDAAGEGRLGLDELDERLTAVYAAKTYAELEPVLSDLPHAAPAPAPALAPAPVGLAADRSSSA